MIKELNGKTPDIHQTVFVAENAVVIGDIKIGEYSSIWFNTVARGDVNYIRIGKKTNIQDNSVLHVTTDTHPLIIGDEVTAGHRVILHGCNIADKVLIGMGAIVLDGAVVEKESLVGAGCLVPPGFIVPSGTLVTGIPARVKRELTESEINELSVSANNYVNNSRVYFDTFK